MQLQVRDKTFDITFVNNWCREQYQEMLCLIDEISTIPDQYDEIRNSERPDKEKLAEMKALNTQQHELTRQISGIRSGIIQELLETNGHEFEKRWWERKTDVDDLNDFMLSCMQKDLKGGGSKKK